MSQQETGRMGKGLFYLLCPTLIKKQSGFACLVLVELAYLGNLNEIVSQSQLCVY